MDYDELLVRTYIRLVASAASLEIAYKQQAKNPVVWGTAIWGDYTPNIAASRVTEIMKEELEFRKEILGGTNLYHLTLTGDDPFKEECKTLDAYLPGVTPDPEEEYSANTQEVIKYFYTLEKVKNPETGVEETLYKSKNR